MEIFDNIQKESIVKVKSNLISKVNGKLLDFPIGLESLIRNRGVLSGGSISSTFWEETPNDYDIYLTDDSDIDVFKSLMKEPQYWQLITDVNEKYMNTLVDGKLVTANATTFKNGIQVITMSNVSQRLNFDFIHCMPWLKLDTNTFYISKEQYASIVKKNLVVNPNYKLQLSDKRISKYTERGWRFYNT